MAKQKRKVSMPAGIRNKMIAATSMLMVSCIMMVSSTYAWFTLSTAPEVKNISTTVAGNGSLEIALMPANGSVEDISSGYASDLNGGTIDVKEANKSWGNIVQLNHSDYGLNNVSLLPTSLGLKESEIQLSTPVYGADGRISEAIISTAVTGAWDTKQAKFVDITEKYGVRAIGATENSSLTTYGYVVDLAVRLNTASSGTTGGKLLLQTEAIQRISGSNNTETMGGGSYMQFTTVQPGINLKGLLDSIRVTFVQDYGKSGGTPIVLGTARLDTKTAGIEEGPTELTSTDQIPLYLYTETQEETKDAEGNTSITTKAEKSDDNTLIKSLVKNQATQISAIVWLDGESLTNADVAATAAKSLVGTLNLQFATDVTLSPATNAALMNPQI